jgi:hypothetical protein
MKKFLLGFSLLFTMAANSQSIVFNEVSPDPGNNKDEYFELFNTTGAPLNLDCYTFVAYDFVGGGAWVYNLPNVNLGGFGWAAFAPQTPLRYKCGEIDNPAISLYNWNDVLNTTQKVSYYDRVGNNLVFQSSAVTTDLIPVGGGNSAAMAIMLFDQTGKLVNGFFTNNNGVIPTEVTGLANLSYTLVADGANGCNGNVINLQFSTISAPEAEVLAVQQAVGASNNYFRNRDGFCGTWAKGQNCNAQLPELPELTPGTKNSNLDPISSSTAITITQQQVGCGDASGGARSTWNIGVTITDAQLLDATVRIYGDNNYSGSLNAGDSAAVLETTYPLASLGNQVNYTGITLRKGAAAIVQVISASGCVQVIRVFATQCIPLPVSITAFSAARSSNNVNLKWTTSMEQNSAGFSVERNVNGSWQEIGFVPSQATNGVSEQIRNYTFVDQNNSTKGVSQYRLRQVDFDGKFKYSDIRAVRGDGQAIQTLVYPNPSVDGKVNIVFEDAGGAGVSRDISVADMSGRIIKSMKGVTNNSVSITNLTPGMYSLRIFIPATGQQSVEKIVISKR